MVMYTTRPIIVIDPFDGEVLGVHYQSAGDKRPWREWADVVIDSYHPVNRFVIGMPTPNKVLFHMRTIAFDMMDDAIRLHRKRVNPYELMYAGLCDYHDWLWSKHGADYIRQYKARRSA